MNNRFRSHTILLVSTSGGMEFFELEADCGADCGAFGRDRTSILLLTYLGLSSVVSD